MDKVCGIIKKFNTQDVSEKNGCFKENGSSGKIKRLKGEKKKQVEKNLKNIYNIEI